MIMSHLVQAHRVHRSIYTEPEIFDQEMAKIFGGTWVYVAHESQIPEPNDFITTHLGRRELIVTRDRDGQLRALFNRCSHRASTVCQQDQGSARHFQCSYHGWTYSNGNWKLAWDNAADGAHPTFAHRSFVLLNERQHGGAKSLSQFKNAPDETEMYGEDLGNGHLFIDQRPGLNASFWQAQRPIPGQEPYQERLVEEFGDTAPELLDLAAGSMVNLSIFPNLLLKGNHVEVVDPVRVDQTRLHTWMVAAVGVPEEVNVLRMRIAEDFPSLGNPDDLEIFERCQQGLGISEIEWIDMSKGLGMPSDIPDSAGVRRVPVTHEAPMRGYLREWNRLMADDPLRTVADSNSAVWEVVK